MKTIATKIIGFTTLAATFGTFAAQAQASSTVAFLMPDQASTRYEKHDFPGFKAAMEKLCSDCKLNLSKCQWRRIFTTATI